MVGGYGFRARRCASPRNDEGRDSASPRRVFARAATSSWPPGNGGRREDRALVAPAGWCAAVDRMEGTPVSTGSTGTTGLPCAMVLTAAPRSPRCAGLFSHRHRRITAGLTPASGCQDHAAWPSVPLRVTWRNEASITSCSHVRGDRASAPPGGAGCANHKGESGFRKSEIFLPAGLDTISENQSDGQLSWRTDASPWAGLRSRGRRRDAT